MLKLTIEPDYWMRPASKRLRLGKIARLIKMIQARNARIILLENKLREAILFLEWNKPKAWECVARAAVSDAQRAPGDVAGCVLDAHTIKHSVIRSKKSISCGPCPTCGKSIPLNGWGNSHRYLCGRKND